MVSQVPAAAPADGEMGVVKTAPQHSALARVGSAVFFGLTSILIVFVNKILLTNLRFPSFLYVGIAQMAATVLVLFVGQKCAIVDYPRFDKSIAGRIFPLPLLYVVNLISGLGGTQKLNYDLSFDMYGYTLILVNDVFTAANGVYMKKKLEAKDLGKWGLLYYNSLFMILPAMLLALLSGETDKVRQFVEDGGLSPAVLCCLALSAVCGFVLNYSMVLCTHYNSALTTTCVGPIKNLIVTYAGMISSGDYIFQWANFLGVNISVAGSVLYTYVVFRVRNRREITVSLPAVPQDRQKLLP